MGVSQDLAEAAQWLRRAAEQGHTDAQNNLGVMYAQGHGVPRDLSEAERWLRMAAEQGHTDAEHNLAAMIREQDNLRAAIRDRLWDDLINRPATASRNVTTLVWICVVVAIIVFLLF